MTKRSNLFKHQERTVAKMLGGVRTGHLGGADVQTDSLAIECKQRKKLPAWLWSAIEQAERHASPLQQAVVVLHETGNQYDNDLVLMRFSTFQ